METSRLVSGHIRIPPLSSCRNPLPKGKKCIRRIWPKELPLSQHVSGFQRRPGPVCESRLPSLMWVNCWNHQVRKYSQIWYVAVSLCLHQPIPVRWQAGSPFQPVGKTCRPKISVSSRNKGFFGNPCPDVTGVLINHDIPRIVPRI